jgi:hypothetical protein
MPVAVMLDVSISSILSRSRPINDNGLQPSVSAASAL